MILAVDVDYRDNYAVAAGVVFSQWSSECPDAVYTTCIKNVADYVPGKFYKRELPCILALLKAHCLDPDIILVDGYVYLDGISRPGLGRFLYDALDCKIPVIGIAKNSFNAIGDRYSVKRGRSNKPLYVTCEGYDLENAKTNVIMMAGEFRIPVLMKLADQECRKREAGDCIF